MRTTCPGKIMTQGKTAHPSTPHQSNLGKNFTRSGISLTWSKIDNLLCPALLFIRVRGAARTLGSCVPMLSMPTPVLQSAPTSAERFASIPPTSCSGNCSQQERGAELGRGFLAVIAGQGNQSKACASPQLATGTVSDLHEIINPLSSEYGLG